jgi:hypothetical protein
MREKPQNSKNAFIMGIRKVTERVFMLKREKGLSLRTVCKWKNRRNYMKKHGVEIINHVYKKARGEN